jgi:hypothetical protein
MARIAALQWLERQVGVRRPSGSVVSCRGDRDYNAIYGQATSSRRLQHAVPVQPEWVRPPAASRVRARAEC